MYELYYQYLKRKNGEKKPIDTVKDVETGSDTSNYELEKTLPRGKKYKFFGLMKD